ncbi:response regulator [Legionella tunisiensis]|uniref:response regulator n=1 Tax=Legionella tunisiensis TaxID=1034944 RepID=UPI0002E71408|nr:response regulator [Legionella tunisiensis]
MAQLLIVEDNFICQQMYLSLLSEEYQLTLTETAQQALDALTMQFFDCILLDLGLPDRPGEELLPLIRSNPLNKDSAIIVISSHVDELLGQQCQALGANQIYIKPVLPTMLRQMEAIFSAPSRIESS